MFSGEGQARLLLKIVNYGKFNFNRLAHAAGKNSIKRLPPGVDVIKLFFVYIPK
jgi:hypothetical protein